MCRTTEATGRVTPDNREKTMKTTFRLALLVSTALSGAAWAEDVTLTIESWRNDDLVIWQDTIIPAFEAANPGIKVVFAPTAPAEYNAALNAKLDAGSAGDLLSAKPSNLRSICGQLTGAATTGATGAAAVASTSFFDSLRLKYITNM